MKTPVVVLAMAMAVGISTSAHASLTIVSTDLPVDRPIYDTASAASKDNAASSLRDDDRSKVGQKRTGSYRIYNEEGLNQIAHSTQNYARVSKDDYENGHVSRDGDVPRGQHDRTDSARNREHDHDHDRHGGHGGGLPGIPIPGALGLFGTGLAGLAASVVFSKRRHG